LAEPASKAGNARHKPHEGKGSNAGDPRSSAEAAEVKTAFDPDQQSDGKRGRDA
jgi:hypothetical protein